MKEVGRETSAKGDGRVVLHHRNDETGSKRVIGTNGGGTYRNSRGREDSLHPCDLDHVVTIMDSPHQLKGDGPEHKACHLSGESRPASSEEDVQRSPPGESEVET